ncbi:hypothetical protein OBBRIDRAFT_794523 [Obba rivulosa]|uniref:DUF6533 domain-containing protein n=1 Tax=Obba rivulosa TaxID=1052685 RepID=A0A8E2AYX1_9APHY|nr:hypothetical protein OBBRIDRAFT_794523 [Obba rivulosa]
MSPNGHGTAIYLLQPQFFEDLGTLVSMNTGVYDEETSTLYGIGISRYCTLAALSILYYEYLATLSLEVKVYWKRGALSFAAILYTLNRYLALLGGVPIIFEFFGDMSECRQLQVFHQYFIAVTQAIVAGMLTLRTFALYRSSKLILALLIAIICTGVGIAAWSVLGANETADSIAASFVHNACDLSLSVDQPCLSAPWGVILVFDTTVFALTIAKGIRIQGLWDVSLFRILLRDGAAYYGVMVVMNMVNILTILPEQRGMVTTLTNVISSILMTRLMLNLRDSDRRAMPGATSTYTRTDNDIELTDSSMFSHSAGETASTYPSVYYPGEQA